MKAFDLITREFVNYVSYNAIEDKHEIKMGSTYLKRDPGDIILLKECDENIERLSLAKKDNMRVNQCIYLYDKPLNKVYKAMIRPRGFTDNNFPFTETPTKYNTDYIQVLKALFEDGSIFVKNPVTAKNEPVKQLTIDNIISRLDEN